MIVPHRSRTQSGYDNEKGVSVLSGAVMEDGASSCIALVSGVSLCT